MMLSFSLLNQIPIQLRNAIKISSKLHTKEESSVWVSKLVDTSDAFNELTPYQNNFRKQPIGLDFLLRTVSCW